MDFMHQLIQQLINGVSLGSIYALIALGYTMIYGIIKLINFAHGDVYMVGAYIGFAAVTFGGLSIFPALLISMAITAVLGMLVERIAYKPLRHAPRISLLITAIGVSFFLEYISGSHAEYFIQRRGLHNQRATAFDFGNNDCINGVADLHCPKDEVGKGNAGGEFRHGDGSINGRRFGQSYFDDILHRVGTCGGGGRLGRRLLQHD